MTRVDEARKRSKIRTLNPVVRKTLMLIDQSGETLSNLAETIGVHHQTFGYWRRGGNAQLQTIQSALKALGYDLVIQKINQEDDI